MKFRGFAAFLALIAAPVNADSLVDNVNGVALDREGRIIQFTGLQITTDGKVAKLLGRNDKRPEKLDFRMDAKGRTLIPGMIDAHGHVIDLGLSLATLDLSHTNSLAEALSRVAAYIAENPGRKWILGHGWNHEKWGLGRFPTAADLDAIAPTIPIYLTRVDGHAGWANSAAMRAAGITPATRSPAGGRMELAGARPSGIFVDTAQELLRKAIPAPLPKDRDLAFERAQQKLLASGITTITDMGTTIEDWQTFRRSGDRGALRVRIVGYAKGVDQALLIAGSSPTPWLYDSHLKLVGVKLTIDGALGSRGAWLKADYADASRQRGLPQMTSAQLRNLMTRATMDGFQIAVHAIGDAANAEALSAVEELALTFKGDRRWRIEHAQIVDPIDLPGFSAHGVIASMQPSHVASDWRMAVTRMGEPRLGGAYAWRAMLDHKVPLAFGSDAPVESVNPFAGLVASMTREDMKGEPFGGWHPDQRLTLAESLKAFTHGAAFAAFAEDRLGTLEPGKVADFLLIDRDITLVRPAEIKDIKVLETWVGGKRLFVKE